MRIAVLAALVMLLVGPVLRSGAAAPTYTTLAPTQSFPEASGFARADIVDTAATITIDLHGLPITPFTRLSGALLRIPPAYVVWVVDADGRLVNAGSVTPDQDGNAVGTVGPIAIQPDHLLLAISAEPSPQGSLLFSPRDTVILVGDLSAALDHRPDPLTAFLGPSWFLPIVPASLGLFLLRHAIRESKAQLALAPPRRFRRRRQQ